MHTKIKADFNENSLSPKQQKCLDDEIQLQNPFGGFDPSASDNYFGAYIKRTYTSQEINVADAIIEKIKKLIRTKGTDTAYKYLKSVCPLYNR